MSEFEVKDSGKRQEFDTGSRRDTNEGKTRPDLMPPIIEKELGDHYAAGSRKYGDRNYERGQPLCRYYESARRHLLEWAIGMRDENHLIAAAWNLLSLRFTEVMIERGELPKDLDDRPQHMHPVDFFETGGRVSVRGDGVIVNTEDYEPLCVAEADIPDNARINDAPCGNADRKFSEGDEVYIAREHRDHAFWNGNFCTEDFQKKRLFYVCLSDKDTAYVEEENSSSWWIVPLSCLEKITKEDD